MFDYVIKVFFTHLLVAWYLKGLFSLECFFGRDEFPLNLLGKVLTEHDLIGKTTGKNETLVINEIFSAVLKSTPDP